MALDLDLIKEHLVVGHHDDDSLISAYWESAIGYCEGICSTQLISRGRTGLFPAFSESMSLGKRVTSVELVTYIDATAEPQTLDPTLYGLEYRGPDYFLVPAAGETWPAGANYVTVSYTAGDVDPPAPVEQAVLLVIGHLYQNRETTANVAMHEVPHSVEALLRPYAERWL